MREIASKLNESRTTTSTLRRVLEIQNSIDGDFLVFALFASETYIQIQLLLFAYGSETQNLVEPHRVFIKEGELFPMWERTNLGAEPYMFFLFSDLLLYATKR